MEKCVLDFNKNLKNTVMDFFLIIICDDSASICFLKSL